MPIRECRGNLVLDDAEVLVNTVNVRGDRGPTMGNGLALAFKNRWPAIMRSYLAACSSGELQAGRCRLYELPEPSDLFSTSAPRRFWAAFCTKDDWRMSSHYRWIESGLADLVRLMTEGGQASVAIPALGCQNGGLAWSRVRPMIEGAFAEIPVDVRLYMPLPP